MEVITTFPNSDHPVPYESLSEHTSEAEENVIKETIEEIGKEIKEYIIIEDDITIKEEIICYGCNVLTTSLYLYNCIRLCLSCYDRRNFKYNCCCCHKFMLVAFPYEGTDGLICPGCCLARRKEYYENKALEKYDCEDYKDEDYFPCKKELKTESPSKKDKNNRKKQTYKCIKCDTIKCVISRYGSKKEPICPGCYKRQLTVYKCSKCNNTRRCKTWFDSDKGKICKDCYPNK